MALPSLARPLGDVASTPSSGALRRLSLNHAFADARRPPPGVVEEHLPLLRRSFPAASYHEHQQIEPLRAVGRVARLDHAIQHDQPPRHGPSPGFAVPNRRPSRGGSSRGDGRRRAAQTRRSSANSSDPWPPPTSTTTSSPCHSTLSSRSRRPCQPCAIARSKTDARRGAPPTTPRIHHRERAGMTPPRSRRAPRLPAARCRRRGARSRPSRRAPEPPRRPCCGTRPAQMIHSAFMREQRGRRSSARRVHHPKRYGAIPSRPRIHRLTGSS
jgi:hypothetical protein